MRRHSGLDKDVRDFVLSFGQTQFFLAELVKMVETLAPSFVSEDKNQLVIGIGCTGGMHRSVAVAEELHRLLSEKGMRVTLEHRDLTLEKTADREGRYVVFNGRKDDEICTQAEERGCCIIAELCAITLICGNLSISHGGVRIKYNTESMTVAKRIYDTVTRILKLDSAVEIKDNLLKKKHSYTIVVEDAALLLTVLGLEGNLLTDAVPRGNAGQGMLPGSDFARVRFSGAERSQSQEKLPRRICYEL